MLVILFLLPLARSQGADRNFFQACFYAISIPLLAVFIYLRDMQPLKFRDARAVALFWLTLAVNLTIAVLVGNMGGTAPISPNVLLEFAGPSAMLYYYCYKV